MFIKALNMLTSSISICFMALLYFKRNDYVLVVNLPPLLPFLITIAARIRRSRILLLIHDVYPDVLVAIGMLNPRSILTRLFQYLFTRLYQSVDRILVLGRDMQSLLAQKLGYNLSRISIVPNAADLEDIYPLPQIDSLILGEIFMEGKFVVKYSGHMGRSHGIELLLEVAERMSARAPDVHFVFIGSGPKKRWLEEACAKRNYENVTVMPYRPRAELRDSINACHLGIIAFVPGMCGISVPGRMYDLLAAGKPMIAVTESNSELALMLREERVGWVASPNKVDEIVEAILAAKSDPELLSEMAIRARRVAETKYSLENQAQHYCHAINLSKY